MAKAYPLREEYTVGWLCALPIELAAAEEMLDEEHPPLPQLPTDDNMYTLGRIGDHNVVIACLPAGQVGTSSAANVALQMQSTFRGIRFGLMVGIGGGVPSSGSDIRLGDVVVSQPHIGNGGVIQYDFGKSTPSGFERIGFLNMPPAFLLGAVAKLKARHHRQRAKLSTYLSVISDLPEFSRGNAGPDVLFKSTYNHVGGTACEQCSKDEVLERPPRNSEDPVVHCGTIASGNQVMRDGMQRDRISAELGGVLCFEMEAAGLMNRVPCLVIRGICDYADSHKNKRWHSYAAATAAACAKEVLSLLPAAEVAMASTVHEIVTGSHVTGPPISTLPFERDGDFIGREDIIDEVDRRFELNHRVAIAGIGGIGKSQIAIEYCYRFRSKTPSSSILWVYASSQNRFLEAYQTIGRQLRLPGSDDPNVDILQKVFDWLSDEANGTWLMILDSVDDMEIFFDSAPNVSGKSQSHSPLSAYVPRSPKGKVLVTTRDTRVGERLTDRRRCVMVPPLALQEAERLLKCKLHQGDDWIDPDAAHLLEMLDYLPLSITQAAAFICENYCSSADHLKALNASNLNEIELLSEHLLDPRRDREAQSSVVRTWKLSFDLIRSRHPRAAEMISLAAVLDRQGIPKSLLRRDEDRDKGFMMALGTLQAFSFLEAEKGGETFVMHRLVQLCMLGWLEAEKIRIQYDIEALIVLSSNFPMGVYENWKECEPLVPHVRKVLGYTYTSEVAQLSYATLCYNMAWYDWSQGVYKAACEEAERSWEIRRRLLGSQHYASLASLSKLGAVLHCQGRYAEARKCRKQVMETNLRVLGMKHPETVTSMSDLASTYWVQGQWKEAEELEMQAVKTGIEVLGKEHPDTLRGMNDLSYMVRHRGRLKEAEDLQLQIMEADMQALGKEHPNTLITMNNLSITLQEQGRWNEAEDLQRQVLEKRMRVLSKEHPDTLLTMSSLSVTLREQGRLREAETLGLQVIEMIKRVLGEEHPDTLTSMSSLAYTWKSQGRYDEALTMMKECLEMRRRKLGPSTRAQSLRRRL